MAVARIVGKPEVDRLGEIGVGEGEAGGLVQGEDFHGLEGPLPNPEIVQLALEVGSVAMGAVADGEEVGGIGDGEPLPLNTGGIGHLYAVEVKLGVDPVGLSVPGECNVRPLVEYGRAGGGVGRGGPEKSLTQLRSVFPELRGASSPWLWIVWR